MTDETPPKPKKAVKKGRRRAPARQAMSATKGTGRANISRGQHKVGSDKWIKAQEDATRALELRKAGWTYEAIANEVGYGNKGTAMRAIVRMLESSAGEVAEHVRRLESARLDTMTQVLWPHILRADYRAIDRMLAVMERRAIMLGTDAPIRIQQTVITEDQFLDAIKKLESERDLLKAAGGADWDDAEDAEIVQLPELPE